MLGSFRRLVQDVNADEVADQCAAKRADGRSRECCAPSVGAFTGWEIAETEGEPAARETADRCSAERAGGGAEGNGTTRARIGAVLPPDATIVSRLPN